MRIEEPHARYLLRSGCANVAPADRLGSHVRVPRDWLVAQLGRVAAIRTGGTPSRSVPAYWGGEIPWVTTAEIKGETIGVVRTFITPLGLERSAARLEAAGTLLVALYGQGPTRGRVGILGIEASTNQACAAIAPSSGLFAEFLFHLLDGSYERLRGLSNKGSQDNLSGALLKRFEIAIPPPREQRAIAAALSDVDELLGALEVLIAKKRAIKQAAMQQLLTGKTRLPGFSGQWGTRRLGDVADIRSGATPSTDVPANWHGPIPWCTPTDITGTSGKYLTTTERGITAEGLASCAASLLPAGALLLCSRATIGEVKIATTEICTNQGFKSLVCRSGTSNEFLYYLLLMLKPQMLERAIGSTFLEIGKHDVASIAARFPSEAEQTAIAAILCDLDTEITALESRHAKTRAIKQGMSQQLLTGRIRLVTPAEVAAPA